MTANTADTAYQNLTWRQESGFAQRYSLQEEFDLLAFNIFGCNAYFNRVAERAVNWTRANPTSELTAPIPFPNRYLGQKNTTRALDTFNVRLRESGLVAELKEGATHQTAGQNPYAQIYIRRLDAANANAN